MSWRAFLRWDDEQIEIEGDFSTEEEAYEAADEAISEFHTGNWIFEQNNDDYDDTEPEIEVWEDDDDDDDDDDDEDDEDD